MTLFRYGGPNSQSADVRFRRDWHHYLACEKKIIVLTVDGRGTGLQGRPFRNVIRDDLGRYEVIDQVNAAREWAKKRYVDIKRIGIWGWVSRGVSIGLANLMPFHTELWRLPHEQGH